MRKINFIIYIIISLFCLFIFNHCKHDVLEQDISNETLIINAPTDNLTLNTTAVTFWWEFLEGAIEYRIQVVYPNFDSTQILLLDVTTTDNKYDFTIEAGTYQWRIRAENGTSHTAFITRTLTIDSGATTPPIDTTSPIAPILVAPASEDSLSDTTILFVWNSDTSTIGDSLYIYNPDSLTLLSGFPIYTANQNYTFDADTNETYFWQLRSVNNNGILSTYSEKRKFYTKQ